MRINSATVGLWLLATTLAMDAVATENEPGTPVTSQRLTHAILEGFRKETGRPPEPEVEPPVVETAEKVVLRTMRINTRRWYDEGRFTAARPPQPILGTGVKEYRNGAIKVRSVLFIPVCISIDR